MCQLKSGNILKDRVFIGEFDSHTDMLNELGIEDNRKNAENLFIRAELIPPNGDAFCDIDTWRFHVDQDIIPEWFVEPYEKDRMIKAVKEWASKYILIGHKNETISNGTYYLKNCIDITFKDNSTVTAHDNSTVTACGNSTAIIPNSSSNKRANIVLMQNSTLKDCKTKTIYQSGNWQYVVVEEQK